MKVGLDFIEQVRSQANWVALQIERIVAGVVTSFHKEHNDDDTHGTIHASGPIFERERTVAIGDWIDVAFAATNFTGSASMTWTVTSAQQVAFSYLKLGTTIYLNYWIEGAALGGTASASLRLKLPENVRIAQYASAPFYAVNGAATTGRATATPGDRFITLFKTDNTNWSLASTVTVQGQIALEVSDSSGDLNVLGVDPILTYTGGSVNFGANSLLSLTTAGSYTMTVNRAMTLTLAGYAGGGGGASGGGTDGGGGGGGGARTTATVVALQTGKTYTLIIGAGGAANTAGANTSLVNTTDTVTLLQINGGAKGLLAVGGAGGALVTGSNGVTGGAGGAGATTYGLGGDGALPATATGGGGGGGGTGDAGADNVGGGGGNGGNGAVGGNNGQGNRVAGGFSPIGAAATSGANSGSSFGGAAGLSSGGGAAGGGAFGGGGGGGGGGLTSTPGAGGPGSMVLTFVSAP